MPLNEATLLMLAQAVADGSHVDWEYAESSAATEQERLTVQRLRAIAQVRALVPETETKWGPLEVRGEVGAGTFGSVHRTWDPKLEREVALKLLHADTTDPAL